MAEELREIPHENYLSLGSKDTAITLDDVSISPTKKREQKRKKLYICLLGKIISVESSSESEETAMPLVDVPISPEKERDEDLKTRSSFEVELESSKTHKEDFVPLDLSMWISGSPNLNFEVTCARINKDLTEDARKFKKMRSLSKEEKVEEKRAGVLTELPLYPWTIEKTLTESDINHLSRLMLNTSAAETHIMRHLSADVQKKIQEGIGIKVKAYDHDTDTEHDMVFKRHVNTSKNYVFNGGWAPEFVRRKDLKQGDKIGLFWGNIDSRLHFRVLQKKKT